MLHLIRYLSSTRKLGISDRLAEQLTNAIPEDVLQSFVELYCNFWRESSHVFVVHHTLRSEIRNTQIHFLFKSSVDQHTQQSNLRYSHSTHQNLSSRFLETQVVWSLLSWLRIDSKRMSNF